MTAILALLRERTQALVPLPADEEFALELVAGEPWSAFNYYLGRHRSRIVVNTDLPFSGAEIVHLAAHEGYPGHHTEHATKEELLARAARAPRGVAPARADAAGAPQRGNRRARRRAPDRRRARAEFARILQAAGVPYDAGRGEGDQSRTRAARLREPERGARDPRGRAVRGGGAGLHRALGAGAAEARRPLDRLHHRSDLASLRRHLHRGAPARARLRGRRPRPLPEAADGAGARSGSFVPRQTERPRYRPARERRDSPRVRPFHRRRDRRGLRVARARRAGDGRDASERRSSPARPRSIARSRLRAPRSTATGARPRRTSARASCTRSPTRSRRTATSSRSSSRATSARRSRR